MLRRSIQRVRGSTDFNAADKESRPLHEQQLASDECIATSRSMAIFITFLLGIGNFAVHKAVLESRHPMLEQLPAVLRGFGGNASLIVEFVLLAGTLLLAANGHPGWGWAYFGYSVLNGVSGWLIVSHRM